MFFTPTYIKEINLGPAWNLATGITPDHFVGACIDIQTIPMPNSSTRREMPNGSTLPGVMSIDCLNCKKTNLIWLEGSKSSRDFTWG